MYLELRSRRLDLTSPAVMGIVNVTPDSFSDGGRYAHRDAALRRALAMVEAGAAIVDLGGESTRPGAVRVSGEEQRDRVLPVVEALRRESDVLISVDTGDAGVIRAAIAAGADMINDVYGLRHPGTLEAVAESDVGVCVMHMQGEPATMQRNPSYDELPGDVIAYLEERLAACEEAGIGAARIAVDPGFGFGKTDRHNVLLLARLERLEALGRPIIVGLSRKGTLGRLTGRPVGERLAAGLAAAVLAVERGARIVRSHDVPATVDALRIVHAVRAAEHPAEPAP